MSKQTDVAQDAEAMVGQQLHWEPTHLALLNWATTAAAPHAALGTTAADAINCYSFPLLLAVRRGFLGKAAVNRILGGTMGAGTAKAYAFTNAWSATLWED